MQPAPDAKEVIVIGSGFGGSSAAMTLAERGFRVTVIERGPWRATSVGRRMAGNRAVKIPTGWRLLRHGIRSVGGTRISRKPMLLSRHGLFDYYFGKGLDVVGSSSVGGNSHIYGAISVRPDSPDFWDTAGGGLSASYMARHYDAVESLMQIRTVGADLLGDAALGRRYPEAAGLCFDGARLALPLAVRTNPQCDAAQGRAGLLGCADGSKSTTDVVFLGPYLASGKIRVIDLHEVSSIVREGAVWQIGLRDLTRGTQSQLAASRVILAGGSFNSVSLLLACRDGGLELPHGLGEGFGGNGDVAGLWVHRRGVDLTHSFPTLQRVLVTQPEAGGISDIVEGTFPSPSMLPLSFLIGRRLRRMSMIAGMGCDAMNGLVYRSGGHICISYNSEDSPVIAKIRNDFAHIAASTGTRITELSRLFTVHPSGGASIGRVVDATGKVYGAPGLYIADGSVFHKALGRAPSLTIAAWARHVASNIN